jgi:hypothetical protein
LKQEFLERQKRQRCGSLPGFVLAEQAPAESIKKWQCLICPFSWWGEMNSITSELGWDGRVLVSSYGGKQWHL